MERTRLCLKTLVKDKFKSVYCKKKKKNRSKSCHSSTRRACRNLPNITKVFLSMWESGGQNQCPFKLIKGENYRMKKAIFVNRAHDTPTHPRTYTATHLSKSLGHRVYGAHENVYGCTDARLIAIYPPIFLIGK